MRICEYGCGREAKFPPTKGRRKWCCSEYFQQCPSKRTIGQTAWNKGKKGCFKEESIQKMRDSHIGQESWNKGKTGIYSEESLKKMSESHKGKEPWNKNIELPYDVWNKGKYGVYSEDSLNQMSESHKNPSEEIRQKLRDSHIGQKAWNKGMTNWMSEENTKIKAIKRKVTLNQLQKRYPTFFKVEEIKYDKETKDLYGRCKNHKCKNSKENDGWFKLDRGQIYNRAIAVEDGRDGCYFYCCEECKQECPLYNKSATTLIKQDQIRTGHIPESYYTTEEYQTCREEVFKRDNNECLYCGGEAEHMHHIRPQKIEPFFSLDPDYCISVCSECHYKYGHKDECSTGNLAQKVCA